ncbi:MAG: energy transducer TonB [Vicingaceae bacterium]
MEPKKNPQADLESKRGIYFSLGLVVVLAIVLVAFEWKTYEQGPNSLGQLQVDDMEEEIIPITQQNTPPPPPPPPPPPQEILEIVEDDKEIEDEVEILDSEADMDTEIFEQPEEVIEEPEIFTIVEDMPVFPGCEGKGSKEEIQNCTNTELQKFIIQNAKFPAMARDAGISGTVYIRYLIDERGEVKNVQVVRGVSGGKALDNEAVRVIESLPKMKPGKQRGKAVRVQYTVPVKFNLR